MPPARSFYQRAFEQPDSTSSNTVSVPKSRCYIGSTTEQPHIAETYGIFRVPGSIRVTNALYDYYCADVDGEDVASTTRCPNLPSHLNCGVHDVASTFKRILAGLPGGILGSLSLFDSLVAIHSQLHGYAEYTRTKESKLRARLIALAISTVKSQYQRELICAVFGLLCMVGRAAENAPREDGSGRPLPTSELMGYGSLAIVFGPLLLGDLLDSYSMKLADPASGLIILPLTPTKSKKRRKAKAQEKEIPSMLTVDRVLVANDITEMLLVHWRDIVKHMKELDYLYSRRATAFMKQPKRGGHMRYSSSEALSLGNLTDLHPMDIPVRSKKRASLPFAASPTPSSSKYCCLYISALTFAHTPIQSLESQTPVGLSNLAMVPYQSHAVGHE
jgi:hypothetical protein